MSYLSKIMREQRDAHPTPEQVHADALAALNRAVGREVQQEIDYRTAVLTAPMEYPAAVRATIPACFRRIT